jgi:predicted enzyme related to lactoylglutathione lyase
MTECIREEAHEIVNSPIRGDAMANTFDWIEIRTRDAGAAARFYEAVFGWRVVARDDSEGTEYLIFDTGEAPRAQNLRRGAIRLAAGEEAPGVVVYVLVEDIDGVLAQVEEAGGEVAVPKTPQEESYKAYFRDPDGNLLGLWEEKEVA